MNYNIRFEQGHQYHIYNRAIGSELMFFQERNYAYFLKNYFDKLTPFLSTLAYCLLPNHFHFLVEVRSDAEIDSLHKAFRVLFISYSQAINKQESRKGSLFMKPFKRKKIDSASYLSSIVAYIHLNPWLHNNKRRFESYKWSSYQLYLSNKHSKIDKEPVLNWFGGIQEFIEFHASTKEFKSIDSFKLE